MGGAAAIRIREPLFGRDLIPYRFLALCSDLHTLLDKELMLSDTLDSDLYQHQWADSSETRQILDEMRALVARADPSLTLQQFMCQHKVDHLYPIVAFRMGFEPAAESDERHMRDYLSQLALMSQVLTLSQQLRVDLVLPSHKYFAHQIALLYQCINQVGLRSAFKARIEARFDEIKAVTERTDRVPLLDAEQQAWVCSLVDDLQQALETFSGKTLKRIGPMRQFVADHPVRRRPQLLRRMTSVLAADASFCE